MTKTVLQHRLIKMLHHRRINLFFKIRKGSCIYRKSLGIADKGKLRVKGHGNVVGQISKSKGSQKTDIINRRFPFQRGQIIFHTGAARRKR